MNRRALISTLALSGLPTTTSTAHATDASTSPPRTRTRWSFRASEGLDAIAFLGPLSGKDFYARYYPDEIREFKPRLAPAAMGALNSLFQAADDEGYLLWPRLTLVLSGGPTDTVQDLLDSIDSAQRTLRPKLAASVYWTPQLWQQFETMMPRLRTALRALIAADFAAFRRGLVAPVIARADELKDKLSHLDVIAEQERLVGRALEPEVELNLLWFCRPHGVKIQGQRFIAHVLASEATVVLTAAHEVLHPPLDMRGAVARGCIAQLESDPLLLRILAEKIKDSGYNSVEGIFEEDLVQALDQIVQERLGYGKAPATRWAESDEGMHVLAAGLYGMLKADGFDRTGGNIETWIESAQARGRLAHCSWQEAAAAILQRDVRKLWTPPSKQAALTGPKRSPVDARG